VSRQEDLDFFSLIDEEELPVQNPNTQQYMDESGVLRNRPLEEQRSLVEQTLRNLKSSENALVRGGIKGITRIGQSASPLDEPQETDLEAALMQYLPTQGNATSRTLERFGELAPYAVGGGIKLPESLARTGIGAILGQAIQEKGGGPIPQAIGENIGFALPSFSKRIIGKNAQQQKLIDFAREQGLTENEIAPLLQEEKGFKNFLSHISPKGGKTQERLDVAKMGQNHLFEQLKKDAAVNEVLNGVEQAELYNSISEKLRNMPNSQRSRITEDLKDLINSKGSIEDVVNFYRDVNAEFKGERDIIQTIKEPIVKALKKKNPNFANKFELTNDLASRYYSITKRLKNTPITNAIETGLSVKNLVQGIYGLISGDMVALGELIGEVGSRKVARELLTNPRFQNLSKQFITATKKNKLPIAKNIYSQMVRQLRKQGVSQEIIDKFQDVSEKDIQEFLDLVNEKEQQ